MKNKPPIPSKGEPTYPMRINKYLAHKGYATRRGADELVSAGKIMINGKVATLGDKVSEKDTVEVRKPVVEKKLVYLAYHKPVGTITHSPQRGEKDIKSSLGGHAGLRDVFPVGRLDKDSSGLIILTNDGRITDRLLNPDFEHDKEYEVTVREPLKESFKNRMEKGVDIEGCITKPARMELLDEHTFRITLQEGKKHQIRRMAAALGNVVTSLKRVRVLNINLGSLPPNAHQVIKGDELQEFLGALGL